jgi:predicted transport protein
MDKATQTMIDNLQSNTGKTLDQWIALVRKAKLDKHGAIINLLKNDHGLSHGYANLIAFKARGSDADSVADKDTLIDKQYKGKEHLKPIYDRLLVEIKKFGKDVEVAPKNTYVSLRRKKQFALLNPATKSRFEVGINLKGEMAHGKLEAIPSGNAMCSHRINLYDIKDINKEVVNWLKKAYEQAG